MAWSKREGCPPPLPPLHACVPVVTLQVAALCGVHCLNTLLQGPYFTEVDLAHVSAVCNGKGGHAGVGWCSTCTLS